jgi:hypothetical protein
MIQDMQYQDEIDSWERMAASEEKEAERIPKPCGNPTVDQQNATRLRKHHSDARVFRQFAENFRTLSKALSS